MIGIIRLIRAQALGSEWAVSSACIMTARFFSYLQTIACLVTHLQPHPEQYDYLLDLCNYSAK